MIIADQIENKAVLSDSLTEKGNYTIKASAKAFHILSTSLYTDSKLAIIRELACNARDSHKEAGVTKPWRLHLPTAYEPMLEIEDYGVGLSHEQVMNLFTTFFESTKTNSNEMVGALGLGSKSPFSYTDNYTVIATKNGVRNTYSAYKTDEGIPAIVRLDSSETDAENGVCIQIAVKSSDFRDFQTRACTALRFFDQYPLCNISGLFSPDLGPIKVGDTDLSFQKSIRHWDSSIVVMGGIGYPIDKNRPEFAPFTHLLQKSLVIRADIGDVEMTPSREALTYNKKTVDWVLAELGKMELELKNVLTSTYKGFSCDYDRLAFLNNKVRDDLFGSVAKKMLNEDFPGNYVRVEEKFWQDSGITYRTLHRGGSTKNNYVSKLSGQSTLNHVPNSNDKTIFVWVDKKFSVTDMVRTSYGYNQIFVFYDTTPESRVELTKMLYGKELVKASGFFKATEKEKKKKTEFYTFRPVYSRRVTELRAIRESGDLHAGVAYYVPVKHGKIISDVETSYNITRSQVEDFVIKNRALVVGFPVGSKKTEGLVSVYDLLNDEIDKEISLVTSNRENLTVAAIQLYKNWGCGMSMFENFKLENMKLDDPVLINMIKVAKGNTPKFKYLHIIKSLPNFDIEYDRISLHLERCYAGVNFNAASYLDPSRAEKLLNAVHGLNF